MTIFWIYKRVLMMHDFTAIIFGMRHRAQDLKLGVSGNRSSSTSISILFCKTPTAALKTAFSFLKKKESRHNSIIYFFFFNRTLG